MTEELTENDYEILDACLEFAQGKIAKLKQDIEAYKQSEQEASEIIAELKEEIKQLHNGRNPEELYTLFGKPIRYWEELKAENDRLKQTNKELAHYLACMTEQRNRANTCLQEAKAILKNICGGCTSECDCDEDCNYFLITEQLTKAEEE